MVFLYSRGLLYEEFDVIFYLIMKEILHTTDLVPPMPKKEFGKRRFSYNGASHWNNLLYEAKSAESLSSFKTTLK